MTDGEAADVCLVGLGSKGQAEDSIYDSESMRRSARVELGDDKIRIAKNLARAQAMFALANLYAPRHRLMPAQARCVL